MFGDLSNSFNRFVGQGTSDISNSFNRNASDLGNSVNRTAADVAADPVGAYEAYLRAAMGGVLPDLANGDNPLDIRRDKEGSKIELPDASNARDSDFTTGRVVGTDVFYSPEMQQVAARLKQQAQGYTPKEISAARELGNRQVEGVRTGSIRQIEGQAGKGQMGGARAAAMQGIGDRANIANKLETERKLANDNAAQMKKSNNDATTFLMNQRFGELGTGLGYAGLGASDRATDAQLAIANRKEKKGLMGELTGGMF